MVSRQVRASARLLALILLTLTLLGAYGVLRPASASGARGVVRLWYRSASRIAGVRLNARGTPCPRDGTLLVANHISYLDILAIGALTDASFVAKADVDGWPVIGFLARLVDTIFVDRARVHVRHHVAEVRRALAHGRTVVMFPEGTSTRGRSVLPFKSTLFETAQGHDVQPLTIAYARDCHGTELSIVERTIHPWVGDDALVPHLWTLLQHPGVTADVLFHTTVAADAFASRKALAEHCHSECARGLALARRGLPVATVQTQTADGAVFALLG